MSKVLTVQYNSFCSAQVQKILECHPLDCFWFRPISSDLWKWDAQTSMYTGRLHQAVNTTGMFEPTPSNNTSQNLTAFWPPPWSPSHASIAEGKISTSMWAKATGLLTATARLPFGPVYLEQAEYLPVVHLIKRNFVHICSLEAKYLYGEYCILPAIYCGYKQIYHSHETSWTMLFKILHINQNKHQHQSTSHRIDSFSAAPVSWGRGALPNWSRSPSTAIAMAIAKTLTLTTLLDKHG